MASVRSRRPVPRLAHLGGLALVATIATAAFAFGGGDEPDTVLVDLRRGTVHEDSFTFEIEAPTVRGLHPGAAKAMPLSVRNPYRFDLRIVRLAGSLTATSDRRCAAIATNLGVRPHEGRLPLVVPARSRRSAGSVTLSMPNTVANACQRVSFTVTLTGSGTKVHR